MQEKPVFDFTLLDEGPEHYFNGAMGWYLHGELDNLVGGDLCATSVDPRNYPVGIYEATCYGHNCTFFFWKIYEDNYVRHRGLVVLNSDSDGMEFARKKFDSNATGL